MAIRRVELVLPEAAAPALTELAEMLKRALTPRYKVRIRITHPDGDEYMDDDSTPVDFRPAAPPLIIQISEGEPTLSSR